MERERITRCIRVDDNGCWIWLGAQTKKTAGGYAQMTVEGKRWRAHRFAYTVFREPIPEGMVIDHLCRVRICVNPFHLEVVTQKENLQRGNTIPAANAAKTHCPQNHELSGTNLRIRKDGSRRCLRCHADEEARRKARR